MRSPDARGATADVVARDPALALATLLDDDALTAWLTAATGVPGTTRRRYLRYKPGTSCVLLAERTTAAGTGLVVVTGYAPGAAAKLEKALEKAAERGAGDDVVAVDRERGLLVLRPAADRHLPGLLALGADPRVTIGALLQRRPGPVPAGAGEHTTPGPLRTLAYKPQRRWVGSVVVDDATVLLRAYRSGRMRRHLQVLRRLQGTGAPVPTLLGVRGGVDLLACRWVDGESAETLVTGHRLDPAHRGGVVAIGGALARLHGRADVTEIDGHDHAEAEAGALEHAAAAVAVLLPGLGPEVTGLVHDLRGRRELLRDRSPDVLVHGDLSLDQVVLTGAGPVLLDLDRAGRGPAAADLGDAVAALLARPGCAGVAGAVLHALREGYATGGEPPPDQEVALAAAVNLVRRAVEPFRHGETDWTGALTRSLELARLLVDEGLDALAHVAPAPAPVSAPVPGGDLVGAGAW